MRKKNINPKFGSVHKDALSRQYDIEYYINGIKERDRMVLAQAITIIESSLEKHRSLAREILSACDGIRTENQSIRIGITGSPGVGKSSFIEYLGTHLIGHQHSVAILAIDPSSQKSGGSILGDKSRMNELSRRKEAFIRPTAAGQTLGGIHANTKESIQLCEAAGFDTIIVETVGVGQSEIDIQKVVDLSILLINPAGGDELQGIKRGIVELADIIVVNKADGERVKMAKTSQKAYKNALHLFPSKEHGEVVKTFLCSSLENDGIEAIHEQIKSLISQFRKSEFYYHNRKSQDEHWLRETINHSLFQKFMNRNSQSDKLVEIINNFKEDDIGLFQALDRALTLINAD